MLPQGLAQKVTIYLNEDTRFHIEPLWSAILGFLRSRHVSGATIFRADLGFGSHKQYHDPRSEYMGEHRPIRIEFVETTEHVDQLLPTLYEMVTDGLITVQDLRVVKSVAKDQPEASPPAARKYVTTKAKLLRVYLGESDKYHDEPLYEAIVKRLHREGCPGATVCRGILGYGVKGHTRKGGRFHLSHDFPIMISVIETADKMDQLIQLVSSMMQDGIIITSDVELHQIVHTLPTQELQNEESTR